MSGNDKNRDKNMDMCRDKDKDRNEDRDKDKDRNEDRDKDKDRNEDRDKDREYMRRALELGARGRGWTAPNPMVGAVIVKGDRILGEGYHRRYGELHAERNALAAARKSLGSRGDEELRGAAMYVTLEPCCHWGKTPPCTEAILEAGIGRVIIGSRDPNPKVAGGGASMLREAGVAVTEDFLREECDRLNPAFFHYITTGLPFVAMKYAMTADGKIAAVSGESKWITGEEAREDVQRLRHEFSGIMAGIGTVLQDDPLLTCRMTGGKNPVRIICDSHLRIPEEGRLCRSSAEAPIIIATLNEKAIIATLDERGTAAPPAICHRQQSKGMPPAISHRQHGGGMPPAATDAGEDRRAKIQDRRAKIKRLEALGIQVMEVPAADQGSGLDLAVLMRKLAEHGVDSILLEGGGTLNYSMMSAGLVQKIYAYIAPKLFGGAGAKTPVEGTGVSLPSEAFLLSEPEIRIFGGDIRLEYKVKTGEIEGGERIKCLQES